MIIRNLTFRDWDDDAINVQESAKNIWIDHNTFSNGFDGAVDIKRGSDFVTVSWNRVFNHDKSMLLGHSDDNGAQDIGHLRVTLPPQLVRRLDAAPPAGPVRQPGARVQQLLPRQRWLRRRLAPRAPGVLVEGNYFENVADPYHLGEADSGPGTPGGPQQHSRRLRRRARPVARGRIPYSYTLDAVGNVKSIVTAGAGAGRITV